jgi:outer membrane biosynthesis protein TonB
MPDIFEQIMLGQQAILRAYAGEKIKQMNVLTQGGANLVYNHGVDVARKLGFTDEQISNITPFPAPTTIVVSQPPERMPDPEPIPEPPPPPPPEPTPEPPEPVPESPEPEPEPKKKNGLVGVLGTLGLATLLGAGGGVVANLLMGRGENETPPPVTQNDTPVAEGIDPSVDWDVE